MSKMMVKRDGLWTPMANLKGDTGPLPADNSVTNDALVTDGAKTNTAYLMGNRWTKDAEGELISVDDSYPSAALSLTVDGKSTQVTTTGKNLIPTTMPSNAIHATISGSGSDISGTLASAGNAWVYAIPCERNTQYVYQASRNGAIGAIGLSNTDSLHVNDTVWKVANVRYISSRTFSSGEYDYILLQNTNTAEFNNMPANKVMLSVGSSITDYEPYSGGAASPRPDWPQEIESIDGILLTTCGKNFVPNDDTENPNANYVFNSLKRVVYDSEVGGFHLTDSGTGIAYTKHAAPSLISGSNRAAFVAPRDGTYTFGVDIKNYSSDPDDSVYGFRVILNGTVLNGYGWGAPGTETEWTRYSITRTLSKGQYFGGNIYHPAAWRNISVVAGEDAYEPYSGGTSSLLPEGTSLRSLPDGTKDELYLTYLRPSSREGWAWYGREVMRRVRVMALDGSETWGKDRFGFYHRMDNLATAAGDYSKSLLCDCLAAYRQYPELAGKAGMSGYRLSATGANWLYINVEGISTISDFQAWLAERVPTILHETTEQPITTQLDPIELPIMQAGTTNIWTDPLTSLSVTYERDRNIVISKLEAAAADLATS